MSVLFFINVHKGRKKMKVSEIYSVIDRFAPFSSQESWDNSGLICGSRDAEVTKVLTALDITREVIEEAHSVGAELIIAHHPIIFHPLKMIDTSEDAENPSYLLIKYGIAAICSHTPTDMAQTGMNDRLFRLLSDTLGLESGYSPLEDCGSGLMIGRVYKLKRELSPEDMSARLRPALGCKVLRYHNGGKPINTVAISSGSGNSFIITTQERGADALISGDINHASFISAQNMHLSVFDCGHFYTERIFCEIVADWLADAPIEVVKANTCTDPVSYVI